MKLELPTTFVLLYFSFLNLSKFLSKTEGDGFRVTVDRRKIKDEHCRNGAIILSNFELNKRIHVEWFQLVSLKDLH